MRLTALALLASLNAAIVGVAWLFHETVVPGWKKGPLIDPASPYAPENAMVLFAFCACLFLDVYVIGLALFRGRSRWWAPWALLAVAGGVSEGAVRGWLAIDMVTYFRPHPTLHWVVRPNLVDFDNLKGGGRITTNADGMRDVSVPRAKAPGETRVLILGDSSNFGHGVEGDEVVSAALGRLVPGVTVINGACPGWTTFQGVEFLRTIGLAYQPDYVIAGFNNDPGPEYLADHARVASGPIHAANTVLFRLESYLLTREVVLSLFRRAAGGQTARKAGSEPLYGKLTEEESAGLVPRVSLEDFRANLAALDAMSPEFVWINMPINRTEREFVERYVDPAYRAAAAEVAVERGFPVVDADGRWSRTREPGLFQKAHVFHPNATGHTRLAQQIAREIFAPATTIEGPPPAATEATLRLGISSLTPIHAHVAAVLEAHPELAAAHGLTLELHAYASGKGQGEDVAGGLLDAFFSCEVPAIRMLEGRTDVRVIAGPGVLGRIAVVARAAETLEGLRGKKIGLSKGSTPAMDWEWWGRELGATTVELSTEALRDALARGDVDAVAGWDPWVEQWTQEAPFHVVASREFRSVLAVSAAWSAGGEARARRLVALVEEALAIAAAARPYWDAEVAGRTGWPVSVVTAVADRNAILAGRETSIALQTVDREILDRAGRFATGGRIGARELVGVELLGGP